MENKRCPHCKVVKPIDRFGVRVKDGREQPQAWCLTCRMYPHIDRVSAYLVDEMDDQTVRDLFLRVYFKTHGRGVGTQRKRYKAYCERNEKTWTKWTDGSESTPA